MSLASIVPNDDGLNLTVIVQLLPGISVGALPQGVEPPLTFKE